MNGLANFALAVLVLLAVPEGRAQPDSHADYGAAWAVRDTVRISFEDALRRAWAAAPEVAESELDALSRRADEAEVRAAGVPRLALDVGPTQGYGLAFDPTVGRSSTQGRTALSVGAGGQVPLFDGGARAARLRQIGSDRATLRLGALDAQRRVALATARAYAQALIGQALFEVSRANLAAQENQLAQVRALVAAGLRPPADTLAQRSAVAGARRDVVNAEVSDETNRAELGRLLALPPGAPVALADPTGIPFAALPFSSLVGSSRPDVAEAQARIATARLAVAAADRRGAPAVSAAAYIGSDFSSLQTRGAPDGLGAETVPFFSQLSSNRRATAGLILTVPIFDGQEAASARARARVELGRAEVRAQAALRDAAAEGQRVRAALRGAVRVLEATEEQVALSGAYANVQQERYRLDVGTLFEWSDAQTRFVAAVAAREQARFTLWLTRVEVLLVRANTE